MSQIPPIAMINPIYNFCKQVVSWRTNQRTSRAEYWWYVTVMAVVIGIVCVVAPSEMRALIIIPLAVSLIPATARRFHDANYHVDLI